MLSRTPSILLLTHGAFVTVVPCLLRTMFLPVRWNRNNIYVTAKNCQVPGVFVKTFRIRKHKPKLTSAQRAALRNPLVS